MHLSKQEFNKLSAKDKKMIMSSKSPKNNNNKNKKPQKTSNKKGPKQASVAAAYATTSIGRAPIIKATRDTCNIKHRELLSNVVGSVDFNVGISIPIQPGLSSSFPWLSIMAQGWEEYRFRSLRFCYKTRTGSTTPGSVIMAPDYDSADGAPATEQIMSTYAQVIEDAPWKDITCNVKTSNSNPLGRRHFVRSGNLAADLDIKTYDVGKLFVATTDGTAIPWGKLWVEYDIDFFIPQLPSEGALSMASGRAYSGANPVPGNPLGNPAGLDISSQGISVDGTSTVTVEKVGTYLVVASVLSGTGVTDVICTAVSGCTLTLYPTAGPFLVSNTGAMRPYVLVTTVPNAKFQMTSNATTIVNAHVLTVRAYTSSIS